MDDDDLLLSPLRILLVDDDDVDRRTVKRALVAAGIRAEVVEFDAGEAALAAVAKDPAAFACGLFDLRLPDRDGLDLLRCVRAAGADFPVVFLTGQGSEDVAVDLMKAGASDYLPKGQLSPARLRQSIGHALRLARTERRQRAAEEALRASEASFRRLADNLPDAVVRFDRDGRHLYVNHPLPWSRAAGMADLTGRTIAEGGYDATTIAPLESGLARALAGRANQVTLCLPTQRHVEEGATTPARDGASEDEPRPGAPRWYEVRLVPERVAPSPAHGEHPVATVLAICRDVTAEVLHSAEREQRLEFERQLIGIVSHDLRNPIGAILNVAQTLQRTLGAAADPRVARALAVLDTSGRRAVRMVSDILDFTMARLSGAIPLRLTPCDLVEVVVHVIREWQAAHPDHVIDLACDVTAHGLFDADRVAQALANLIANAFAYGRPEEAVVVRLEGGATQLALTVSNRGPAIPPETIPMLFRPFQRGPSVRDTRARDRSVGLGLFIVEQIVRGHRGRVEVSSDQQLTSFRMILPRRPPSGRMQATTQPELPPAPVASR